MYKRICKANELLMESRFWASCVEERVGQVGDLGQLSLPQSARLLQRKSKQNKDFVETSGFAFDLQNILL